MQKDESSKSNATIKQKFEADNKHCVKSVQIRTRKNSIFGHFSRSETLLNNVKAL